MKYFVPGLPVCNNFGFCRAKILAPAPAAHTNSHTKQYKKLQLRKPFGTIKWTIKIHLSLTVINDAEITGFQICGRGGGIGEAPKYFVWHFNYIRSDIFVRQFYCFFALSSEHGGKIHQKVALFLSGIRQVSPSQQRKKEDMEAIREEKTHINLDLILSPQKHNKNTVNCVSFKLAFAFNCRMGRMKIGWNF